MAEVQSTMETARAELGYCAVLECLALTGILQRELAREDNTVVRTVGPTLLRRLDQLQNVLLDLLDANEEATERLREIIHGARAPGN